MLLILRYLTSILRVGEEAIGSVCRAGSGTRAYSITSFRMIATDGGREQPDFPPSLLPPDQDQLRANQ